MSLPLTKHKKNLQQETSACLRHAGRHLEELEDSELGDEGVHAVLVVLGDGQVGVALDVALRRHQLPRHQLQQRRLACTHDG